MPRPTSIGRRPRVERISCGVEPLPLAPAAGVLGAAPPPFPLWDWQFWVVTLVAALAGAWIIWKLFPRRLLGRRRRGAATRATLTVGGRPVERPGKGADCH